MADDGEEGTPPGRGEHRRKSGRSDVQSPTTGDERHTTAEDVVDAIGSTGRNAMASASAHPAATLLILSGVVIGGSLLVAAMLRDSDRPGGAASSRPLRLSSAAAGLGPRGIETLTKIRDAAMAFAMFKAVETIEELFPGFREHFEHV